MPEATLTSKGQITVPADVRRALRVTSGDRIEFVEVGAGRFEIVAATGSVKDLKGMVEVPTRTVSIDDMNDAIADAASGR